MSQETAALRKPIESAVFSGASACVNGAAGTAAARPSLRAAAMLDCELAGAAAKLVAIRDTRLATETEDDARCPDPRCDRAAALGLLAGLAWRCRTRRGAGRIRRAEPGRAAAGSRRRPLHLPPHRRRIRAARFPHRAGGAMRLGRGDLVLQDGARRARGAGKRDRPAAARQCRAEEIAAVARHRTAERRHGRSAGGARRCRRPTCRIRPPRSPRAAERRRARPRLLVREERLAPAGRHDGRSAAGHAAARADGGIQP